jgi:hypothetical protein
VNLSRWTLAVGATVVIVALLAGRDDIARYIKMRQMSAGGERTSAPDRADRAGAAA